MPAEPPIDGLGLPGVHVLHQRLTVTDLLDLDLTYTPPLSASWDPIQQAAQIWETAHS